LVTRAGKGAPLLDSEMDANWTNIRSYCLTLANIVASSLNPDGTLTANSVGTAALQAAAVALTNLNPSLLYSIVPVDTDSGMVNAYAITAKGGLGGTNLVPAGAAYDSNGNYVLTGLTLNMGYLWTKGASDDSCAPANQTALTASGSFTAGATTVTLTGTPSATVTATVDLVAPISAYKNGQIFFVYTANASTGPSTLNVNNLGAIPILINSQQINPNIGANSVFAVVYEAGSFILFSGGGGGSSSGGTTVTNVYNYTGFAKFTSGNLAVPGANTTTTVAHGLQQVPSTVDVRLVCTTANAGFTVGQQISASFFTISGAPAFVVYSDATSVYVTQENGTPSIGGTAITPADWALVVNAMKQTNNTTTVFPALNYTFVEAQGAFSYNGNLMVLNYGPNQAKMYATSINLSNNEVVSLSDPNTGVPQYPNGALFTRASGLQDYVLTSYAGVYRIPAVNPSASIVPLGALYNSSGKYTLSVTNGSSYTITKGSNDTYYSLDGTTYVALTSSPVTVAATSSSLYLEGNANGSVTASVVLNSATWEPLQIFSNTGYYQYKPVWITETSGSITAVYVVSSQYGLAYISAATMVEIQTSGVTTIGTALDFTNGAINNIAGFNKWHPSGSTAQLTFFQYNPFTKRIYLMTNEIGLIHIFKISGGSYGSGGNDITAFWADTASNRWSNLTYVKSIAMAGMGAAWNAQYYGNLYIEINQSNGLEQNIVFARYGDNGSFASGTVTVVPWVE
jgi:hypothetical protein